MPVNFNKEDLRVQKTHKALYGAMFEMLNRRNFNDITVNNLCSEALISRAAFYTYFNDKYDLLKYMLAKIRKNVAKDLHEYDELENEINQFIVLNKKLIINILKDANSETLTLIRGFMASIVDLMIKRETIDTTSPDYIILLNFSVGGLVNLLTWIVENNFPPEIDMVNTYLYKMLEAITIWDADQELKERSQKFEYSDNEKNWRAFRYD